MYHVTLPELMDIALEINRLDTQNGAEFIISYAYDKEQHIFQVTDGECKDYTKLNQPTPPV